MRLTAGKGLTGTTITDLLDRVVKDIPVSTVESHSMQGALRAEAIGAHSWQAERLQAVRTWHARWKGSVFMCWRASFSCVLLHAMALMLTSQCVMSECQANAALWGWHMHSGSSAMCSSTAQLPLSGSMCCRY